MPRISLFEDRSWTTRSPWLPDRRHAAFLATRTELDKSINNMIASICGSVLLDLAEFEELELATVGAALGLSEAKYRAILDELMKSDPE